MTHTMDLPSRPKSWVDHLETWSKIVGSIGIPVAIFLVGSQVNQKQHELDQVESRRKQLIDIGVYLTDGNPEKKNFGLIMMDQLKSSGAEIPIALIQMTTIITRTEVPPVASAAPAAQTGQPASPAAEIIRKEEALVRNAAVEVLSGLAPRVFIHIPRGQTAGTAEGLRQWLEQQRVSGLQIVTPAVRTVDAAPQTLELRHGKKADATEASKVAELIGSKLGQQVAVRYMTQYENSDAVRGRTYEFWFNR